MTWQNNGILSLLLVVLASDWSIGLAQDDSQFPYQALILNQSAMVRSGPGSMHYPTSRLAQGDVVDVYRHDPGGWCAIRPPQGSFSLVPASVVQQTDSNVGIVTADDVQAWVGTRLGSVDRPLWQIPLKIDEPVEIFGEVSWPNPEGHSSIWYQIAPPAGEFRWIQMSDLQLPSDLTQLPESLTDGSRTVTAEFNQPSSGGSAAHSRDKPVAKASLQSFDTPVVQSSSSTPAVNAGWRKATAPVRLKSRPAANDSTDSFQVPAIEPAERNMTMEQQNNRRDAQPFARVASANISPALSKPDIDPATRMDSTRPGMESMNDLSTSPAFPTLEITAIGPISEKISELEMLLTREMLRSPDQWRLSTLLDHSMAIKESTADPQEKLHADRLIEKIRRCEDIRNNYESTYAAQDLKGFTGTGNNQPVGTGVDTQLRHSTTYDAYGWLNELVSSSSDVSTPSYVIEDDNGRIIYHVSPAPGLNLHRYLKNKVGIIGQRGYHRRLQLNHVTAERVIVLEKIR